MLKHNQTEAVTDEPINKKKLRVGLFPDELIVEILSWLPAKCAGRCKIVCKSWRAIIQSPHFIEQHMKRQDYIVVYPPTRLSPPLPLWPPDQQPFEDLFYLRGLSLEKNMITKGTYRIRNYATNQVFELPDLIEGLISGSMCYLPTSDEYKVLILHWKENDTDMDLKVLTKGTDITWRCVALPALLSCSKNNGDRVSSITIGSVSYITKFSTKSGFQMMAFQIEDESFVEISLPSRVRSCPIGSLFYPMSWDRDFCIGSMVGEELGIWLLQDYKTSKWDERKIVLPSEKYPVMGRLVPHCIFSGEIVVLIVPPIKRMLRVDYNIKTKTARTTRIYHTLRPSLVSL